MYNIYINIYNVERVNCLLCASATLASGRCMLGSESSHIHLFIYLYLFIHTHTHINTNMYI